jgi:two-component sensor histidine kinase
MAGQPDVELGKAVEHGRAADDRWLQRKDGSRFWASGVATPVTNGDGRLRGVLKILRDFTARHREEERRDLLQRELDHRVKNILAVVQSLAGQSLGPHASRDGGREAFTGRLIALARSHDMMIRGDREGAPLREIVARTLEPHADGGMRAQRTAVEGLPLRLMPSAAVMLSLAFHELATNAAKYGALSTPEGRVEVRWRVVRTESGARRVEILWCERGGPPVSPPERRGFGSRLIERGLAQEFGAEVRLECLRDGVECRIRLPFDAKVLAL